MYSNRLQATPLRELTRKIVSGAPTLEMAAAGCLEHRSQIAVLWLQNRIFEKPAMLATGSPQVREKISPKMRSIAANSRILTREQRSDVNG
jgi:hypothetical protein